MHLEMPAVLKGLSMAAANAENTEKNPGGAPSAALAPSELPASRLLPFN